MDILGLWREARGSVMRNELADLLANKANENALSAFYNNIEQTIGLLREAYRPAAATERKIISV